MRPSYPKAMRDHAKQHKLHLITIDVPGMCFQGPVDVEAKHKLVQFVIKEILRKRKGGAA